MYTLTQKLRLSTNFFFLCVDEYDNFTNFENKTIEDIFNFSPVKTTTLLNKYEEPLFELPVSYIY